MLHVQADGAAIGNDPQLSKQLLFGAARTGSAFEPKMLPVVQCRPVFQPHRTDTVAMLREHRILVDTGQQRIARSDDRRHEILSAGHIRPASEPGGQAGVGLAFQSVFLENAHGLVIRMLEQALDLLVLRSAKVYFCFA